MPRSRLDQSFSLSLLLHLRIAMAAANLSLRQRLNRVWSSLINRLVTPIPSLYDQLTDLEQDPDDLPDFWLEYWDNPEVIDSCSQHLERCLKNPSAKHHGH